MFTIADAISRLDAQMEPVWTPGATDDQKLSRINEVLERFWNEGDWEGLSADIVPESSGGKIELDEEYKNLEALQVSTDGKQANVPIKSQLWKFSPSADYVGDWSKYSGPMLAFDIGETDGQRVYQLTGDAATADALTYIGQAKRRYVWADEDTADVVPDCWPALLLGVRAYHWLDQGDTERFQIEMTDAIKQLEKDLGDVQDSEDLGSVSIEYNRSGGAIPSIW